MVGEARLANGGSRQQRRPGCGLVAVATPPPEAWLAFLHPTAAPLTHRSRLEPPAPSSRSGPASRPPHLTSPYPDPLTHPPEQPCATSAAMAFWPSPMPSTIPAAIASTFFSAPQTSTPITSVEVFTRRLGPANRACTVCARFLSYTASRGQGGWVGGGECGKGGGWGKVTGEGGWVGGGR